MKSSPFIRSAILSIFLLVPVLLWAQGAPLTVVAPLPMEIGEASGLEYESPQNIWVHNDSGDSAKLYAIDEQGQLQRALYLTGFQPKDLEDITKDRKGHYYIGDFGNNNSDRTDLRIYRFPHPDSVTGDSAAVEAFEISYNDQTQFPPGILNRNFDCEAMVHFNDSLFLFSKNWGVSKFTRRYALPDVPGNYQLDPIDSFNTGGWITAAALSPNQKVLALLSNTYLWLFWDFEGSHFFSGQSYKFEFTFTQKEGVSFISDTSLYIVDERLTNDDGNLYYLGMDSILGIDSVPDTMSMGWGEQLVGEELMVYPNPADKQIVVQTPDAAFALEIFDLMGRKVIVQTNPSNTLISIPSDQLPGAVYIIRVISKAGIHTSKLTIQH